MKRDRIVIISIFIFILVFANNMAITSPEKNCNEIDEVLSIETKIKLTMKLLHIPSITACVIKDNNIIYENSFGKSHFYLNKKADVNTIYDIGSISKTVTATAVLQLVEQDKIDLDENISHFFSYDIKNPNFPNVNITLRMLLAHQSSLSFDMDLIFSFYTFSDNSTQWIKDRIIPDGKYYKQDNWRDYKPGDNLAYSNTGFIIAGAIIEKITGKNLDEYCKENIFDPLDMKNTSFNVNKLDKNRIARPYYHIGGPLYLPLFHYDLKSQSSFAGLRTTVLDLSKYLLMHINNGTYNKVTILNENTIKEMHRIQYPDCVMPFFGYNLSHGLGWITLTVDDESYEGYNGGALGYCCDMMIRRSDKAAIIMFSNFHFKRFAPRIFTDFKFRVYNEVSNLLFEKAN